MLRHLIPLLLWPLHFTEGDGGGSGGTGAMPGSGAMPGHAGGSGGAAAGATPAAGAGSTPAPATTPATGEEALGDAGKAVLAEARRLAREAESRARAAEARLSELEGGQQTEHERAIAQARRESTAQERAQWSEWGRELIVDATLRAAGITSEKLLALAKAAPELRALKFDIESRKVEGVSEAVEALKKDSDYVALFGGKTTSTPAPGGSWGGAEGGSNATPVAPGGDRLRRAYESGNN